MVDPEIVGVGEQDVQVDVRVVTSTSRDLKAEIAEGRFREDLYYRLNVVPVRIPSLKERREKSRARRARRPR